ncbi:MAG: hypothetical protein IJB71_01515 [Bacilli bacterium]|nr:hypothetical protein [Bacilli bacterium]
MDLNLVRNVLLRIDKMKVGESILIDELNKEFPNLNTDEFLTLICKLALRYYVRVDGKWSNECFSLEKYNKILGLDKEGLEAIDFIKNDIIWEKVINFLEENNYRDLSIFVVADLAKKMINKEFEKKLN